MLALWKENSEKPRQHSKKQRHHFANKGPYSQSFAFPVVMYGCESCIIKKAEGQGIDAFELWCWRRLLRVPWTARSNQSILKEVSPEYSLEGLMLRLKPQSFVYLRQRADSAKNPDSGKDWRQEEERATEDEIVEWHHRLSGCENLSKLQEMVKDRVAWHAVVLGVSKSQTWLSD